MGLLKLKKSKAREARKAAHAAAAEAQKRAEVRAVAIEPAPETDGESDPSGVQRQAATAPTAPTAATEVTEAGETTADLADRAEIVEVMYQAAAKRAEVAQALYEAAEARGEAAEAMARAAAEQAQAVEARELAAAERDAAVEARERAAAERDAAVEAREKAAAERDSIANARDRAAAERDAIANSRDRAAGEREAMATRRLAGGSDAASGEADDAALERARLEAELQRAHLDALTGVFRREMGRLALRNEIERARRSDGKFVIAFIDVDGLKGVNDREGHAAGDRILRTLAATMRANLRSYDPIVRFGGDEFICGVASIDPDEVRHRIGVIDQSLRNATGVGITAGLATLTSNETLDELTAKADAALIEAKRNRSE